MIRVTVPRIGTAVISVVIHCNGSDMAGDNKCHVMICRGQKIKAKNKRLRQQVRECERFAIGAMAVMARPPAVASSRAPILTRTPGDGEMRDRGGRKVVGGIKGVRISRCGEIVRRALIQLVASGE